MLDQLREQDVRRRLAARLPDVVARQRAARSNTSS